METAKKYRERAAHARRLAQKTHDFSVREQLETVATDYDRMADKIEAGPRNRSMDNPSRASQRR